MGKNIVLCCDGTSNEFGRTNTNVVRLFQSLDRSPVARQVAYYHPGVGTLAQPGVFTRIGQAANRALQMGFGVGLLDHVSQAVEFLMRFHEPGDQVFIFGFSRGAYTARAIAGALHKCGLPVTGSEHLLPYFIRTYQNTTDWGISGDFKKTFGRDCPVHFLGLWDTVSTLGWIYNPQHLPYTRMNPNVAVVRHAISLDERRCFFRTNRWGSPDGVADTDPTKNPAQNQDAKEIWFPGVHCDVGGGYPLSATNLWKISFAWMVREAQAAGVKFDEAQVTKFLAPNPPPAGQEWSASSIHESLTALWWPCEFLPKKYWDFHAQPPQYRFRIPMGKPREVPPGAHLHRSIIDRMRAVSGYRPPNLSDAFQQRMRGQSPADETIPYDP
jgi:uncharacterized protein (DUF2235 family)